MAEFTYTSIEIENTGVDHLYTDGIVPIVEMTIDISEMFKLIARKTSLAVLGDDFFQRKSAAQKMFSELHGSGDRITNDFLREAANEIKPVFSAFQRWMEPKVINPDDAPTILTFEYDSEDNPEKIIFRWQFMDTRSTDYKTNYTSETLRDIRLDPKTIQNLELYMELALQHYVMRELYDAIGYGAKHQKYFVSYGLNRQYVAYWLKNETSLLTQYHHAGV